MQQGHDLEIHLSAREHQVLELISYGLTSVDIAGRLFVSENTIEYHRKSLFAKLGVRNAAHLVGKAYRSGLLVTAARTAID